MVWEEENSVFKPVKFGLKIDLGSHPARAGRLVNSYTHTHTHTHTYIYICVCVQVYAMVYQKLSLFVGWFLLWHVNHYWIILC